MLIAAVVVVADDVDSRLLPGHHYHLCRVRLRVRDPQRLSQGRCGGTVQVSGTNQEVTSGSAAAATLQLLLSLLQVSGCRVGALWPQVQHHPAWTNQNQGTFWDLTLMHPFISKLTLAFENPLRITLKGYITFM